jgi:hypothetical protein
MTKTSDFRLFPSKIPVFMMDIVPDALGIINITFRNTHRVYTIILNAERFSADEMECFKLEGIAASHVGRGT